MTRSLLRFYVSDTLSHMQVLAFADATCMLDRLTLKMQVFASTVCDLGASVLYIMYHNGEDGRRSSRRFFLEQSDS